MRARIFSRVLDAPPWTALCGSFAIFVALFILPLMLHEMSEGMVLVGALGIVIYFSARFIRSFVRGSEQAKMIGALEAVAALHLLGLVSYVTFPFLNQTARHSIEELLDLDFWLFPAIFAATWALISVLVIAHYRAFTHGREVPAFRLLAIGNCAILALFAAGALALVPAVLGLFASFGADLPGPTLVVVDAYQGWLIFPVLGIVLAIVAVTPAGRSGTGARVTSGGLIGLLMLANVSLLGTLGALFLPAYKLCGPFHWETGFTRLHAAAHLGRKDSTLRHLERGAAVDAKDEHGLTPLLLAVMGGHYDVARVLLDRGAYVASTTVFGATALHSAAGRGRVDIVELLLARGADVNAEDDRGRTPLDLAREWKESAAANKLMEKGGMPSTEESRRRKSEHPAQRVYAGPGGGCGSV